MSAMIDVEIDVTKMSRVRQEGDRYCLQGWVNKKMTGSPWGADIHLLLSTGIKNFVTHTNHRDPSDPECTTRYDYKVNQNTLVHSSGWPTQNEFAEGSQRVRDLMFIGDHAGVKEKLESYKSVGVNFIPVNLPVS